MFSPIFNNRHQTTKEGKKRGDHNVWHFLRNGNKLLKQRWNGIHSHLKSRKRRWYTIYIIEDHITSTGIVVVHLQYNLMMITLLKNLLYLHFFYFLLHFRFLWYSISILYWNKFALSMMYTADVSVSNIVKLLQSENSSYLENSY